MDSDHFYKDDNAPSPVIVSQIPIPDLQRINNNQNYNDIPNLSNLNNINISNNTHDIIPNSRETIMNVSVRNNSNRVNKTKVKDSNKSKFNTRLGILIIGCIIVLSVPILIVFVGSNKSTKEIDNVINTLGKDSIISEEYDDEDGSIFILLKSSYNCGDESIIRGFGLNWLNKKVSFFYYCTNIKNLIGKNNNLEIKNMSTNWNIINSGPQYELNSVHFLDRHKIDCGENYAISQFKFESSNKREIRYTYTCIRLILKECKIIKTNPTYGADLSKYFARSYLLSRQLVLTSSKNKILKNFVLKVVNYGSRSEPTYQYIFEECEIHN